MNMPEHRLKPCPFCGHSGGVELIEQKVRRIMYSVGCFNCRIKTDFEYSKEWVVYLWNRRELK